MDELVDRFVDAWLTFAETAASNVGYDQAQFEAVRDALAALVPAIQLLGSVPFDVADVFIDMVATLHTAADRQWDRRQRSVTDQLYAAADTLADLAQQAVARDGI
ncbi:MAG: hypothetical protein AB7L13_04770 [Acidimicrobiia bacterium]